MRIFASAYGEINAVTSEAAALAGSWKSLYAARHLAEKEEQPWQKPSCFEIEAAVRRMVAPASAGQASDAEKLAVVFLVDGSGSVTEADFACMQEFMTTAVGIIAPPALPAAAAIADAEGGTGAGVDPEAPAAAPAAGALLLSIIQFSNDVRVELAPTGLDAGAFGEVVAGMARMNGGQHSTLCVWFPVACSVLLLR
jgi:hypothetical protein